jgi:Fic family protein
MFEIINQALEDLLSTQNLTLKGIDRVESYRDIIGDNYFTRQEYLRYNKDISSATASRDLKDAVEKMILSKTGDKRLTKYRYC